MVRSGIFLEVDEPVPGVEENYRIDSTATSPEAVNNRIVSQINNLHSSFIIYFDQSQLPVAAEIDGRSSIGIAYYAAIKNVVENEISVSDAVYVYLGQLAPNQSFVGVGGYLN